MAEVFAPFAIDVTTQEPLAADLWRASSSDARFGTRVAFTSGTVVHNALCGGSCGGVAWIGTFDSVTDGEVRSPAWVFPGSLGNRARNLADAGSHEAGPQPGPGPRRHHVQRVLRRYVAVGPAHGRSLLRGRHAVVARLLLRLRGWG